MNFLTLTGEFGEVIQMDLGIAVFGNQPCGGKMIMT